MPMGRILNANGWGGRILNANGGRILNANGEDCKCQWGGL